MIVKLCPKCGAKESDEDKPLHLWYIVDDDYYHVECDRCGYESDFYVLQ